MGFGKKGLAPGQSAPSQNGIGKAEGFARPSMTGGANVETPDADDVAAKRAAFIAAERARSSDQSSVTERESLDIENPMAALHNSVRPAAPMDSQSRFNAAQERETTRAAPIRSSSKSGYVFGDPGGRSVGLAYVLWFILGQLSIHRFYCGQSESAWFQIGLLFGSIMVLLIFPILGVVGLVGWCFWLFADLFLIPGMMRDFKAANSYQGVFA